VRLTWSKCALLVVSSLLYSVSSAAQQPPEIVFDVSSVKPAHDQNAPAIRRLDIGTVSVQSMTLYDMIALFYHVRSYQIVGGPDWTKQDRFDVVGKDSSARTTSRPSGDALTAAFRAGDEQMRRILKSRFQLEMRPEVRVLPTLVLVADKKKAFTQVPCSSEYRLQHGIVKGAIRISSLTALLKAEYGMPVSDGTGLIGCYDIDARWSTDPDDDSLPSVAAALKDLGFHLKRSTGNVDSLVIERAEKPLPD
jgi:uncharacterized protein (TIGR03435 family)